MQSAPPQRAVKCIPSGTNACHRKMRSILLNENEKKRKRAAAALCGKGDKERRVRGRITDAKLFAVHKSSITRDFPFGKVHKRFFFKGRARDFLRDKNEVMFPGAIQPRPVLVRSNE